MSDNILFSEETGIQVIKEVDEENRWKILIVDDDPAVHTITSLVLKSFTFQNRTLNQLHAYNSEECQKILAENNDIAVVFLDVVMEHEHSGLELVKIIRESLGNTAIRIILRTGQPGQAPEGKVIAEYDINDYRLKTELTAQKLHTSLTAALRGYQLIVGLQEKNRQLMRIIADWEVLRNVDTLEEFMTCSYNLLTSLVQGNCEPPGLSLQVRDLKESTRGTVLQTSAEETDPDLLLQEAAHLFDKTEFSKVSSLGPRSYTAHAIENKREYILSCQGSDFDSIDYKELLRLFDLHYRIALDTYYLRTKNESSIPLPGLFSDFIQVISQEPSMHSQRLGVMAQHLAKQLGLSSVHGELIRIAAPLHDIGNVRIPGEIMNKKGPLSEEERRIIEIHTQEGAAMLKNSDRELFKIAAIIAEQHHERWDGTGYPKGLKGEEIAVEARITAIIDIYDSLTHDRSYREAKSEEDTLNYIREQSGILLDPKIVYSFLNSLPELKELLNVYR